MKVRILYISFLIILLASFIQAQTRRNLSGWCEDGGQSVVTSGLTSVTKVQRSYPSCTVTVYDAGTTNPATIASDSGGTPKANPFTASTAGRWDFWAIQGQYDVQFSGGGIASPFTRGSLWITTPITPTGDVVGPSSATDNAAVRFDLTTGKLIQNSVVLISDVGNVSGLGTLNLHTIPAVSADTFSLLAASQAFTNKTLTSPTNILGTVTMTLGSDVEGDMYYRNSAGRLTRLGIGATNFCLTSNGTVPTWSPCGGSGGGTAGGSSTQVQYNAAGSLAGDVGFTFASSTDQIGLGTASSQVGSIILYNSSNNSGTTIQPGTPSSSIVLTFPALVTDTLAGIASTQTLTNKTLTSSTNTLGGVTLTLGSDATGDIYYRNAGGLLTRLGIGSAAQVLTVSSGIPSWQTPAVTGANTALSNLSAVSINTSLLAQTGIDLGSTTAPFRHLFLFGSGTFSTTSIQITGTPTGARVWTFQDTSDTVVGRATTDTLTNKTVSTNNTLGDVTVNVTGTDATGDIWYRDAGGLLTRLPIGSASEVLTVAGGLPDWVAPAGGTLTVGTSPITSGTAGRVLYETAGNVLGEVSGFTSDGTNVTAGSGNLRATSPRITTSLFDANGNTILNLSPAGSAVNFLQVANAASGSHPQLSAQGAGANLDLIIDPKGSGQVILASGVFSVENQSPFYVRNWNNGQYTWTDNSVANLGTKDTGLARQAAGIVRVTTAGSGGGQFFVASSSDTIAAQLHVFSQSTSRVAFAANSIANTTVDLITGTLTADDTSTIASLATFNTRSNGTAANGFGQSITYTLESSTTNDQTAGIHSVLWTDATHATRTSVQAFSVVNSASTVEALRIAATALTPGTTDAQADLGTSTVSWRQLFIDQTITGGGTTGNQTINKAAGTVNFAAAATTLTVTSDKVTTSSLIFVEKRTNDATCQIQSVVPGSGSFVINMTAGCGAETSVGFFVVNQ